MGSLVQHGRYSPLHSSKKIKKDTVPLEPGVRLYQGDGSYPCTLVVLLGLIDNPEPCKFLLSTSHVEDHHLLSQVYSNVGPKVAHSGPHEGNKSLFNVHL